MILSVSRRTDIPHYYASWFYGRLREGTVCVRNPVSPHQISRIRLSPDTIDCIVFWTKNPDGMLSGLSELDPYPYYFQFTLTGYGKEIEPALADKRSLLSIFQSLSRKVGKERVVWRYDPIFLSPRYSIPYHLHAFREIARELCGYTDTVVISFLDIYAKIKKWVSEQGVVVPDEEQMLEMGMAMSRIAAGNGMHIMSCAEKADLIRAGVEKGCCVDKARIERLMGKPICAVKDKAQRAACGCIESVDIGAYNTCSSGCAYCYANTKKAGSSYAAFQYDSTSPLLCSQIGAEDRVYDRRVSQLQTEQIRLF